MTVTSNEAAKLLSLSMSDSESSSDALRISIPRQKVLAKRKRKRKTGTEKPISIHSSYPFALDSIPKIAKCLLYGFVLAVLIMETWLIIKLSRRVDRLEEFFVDAEGKHVPESLRDMEQRLAHMRANQSQIEQLVGKLSSQLNRINDHLQLVNGSAEELRLEISNTINKLMPSHLEELNSSLAEVQARVTRVVNNLTSTNNQLMSLTTEQKAMDEAIRIQDTSISTIEDVISGRNTSSTLAQGLNSTIETLITKAKANIESSIQQAQSEIHAQMSSSLKDSITEMKRELSSSPKPIEMTSVPLNASNTNVISADNNNNRDTNNGFTVVNREGNVSPETPERGSSGSKSSENSTQSSTTPTDTQVTTRSPANAMSTVT